MRIDMPLRIQCRDRDQDQAMSIFEEFTRRASWFVDVSVVVHVLAVASILIQPDAWRWALLAIAANHVLLSLAGLWPRSSWLGTNWTQLPDDATARNEIALTIDDGPEPDVTPQVLDILDRFEVKASFFCIGEKVLQHPQLCREILRRGHAIENHSMRHPVNFSLLGVAGLTAEVEMAQQAIKRTTGEGALFFRAPAGLRNPFLDQVLERSGLQLVSWSVRGFDTVFADTDRITSRLLGKLKAGAILLLHDGNSKRDANQQAVILEVLPRLLEAARQKQMKFVRLRQVLP